MAKREKSFWLKRFFNSSWFFITILILLLLFSTALVREMMRKLEIQKEVENLETQVATFENDNQVLESMIDYLQTEEFVEKEMRTKLGYKKEGETVVAVPESDRYNLDTDGQLAQRGDNYIFTANWQLWWNYFFGEN